MKEQLERMFPGAVVTLHGSTPGSEAVTVQLGAVDIAAFRKSKYDPVTTHAHCNGYLVSMQNYAPTLERSLMELRSSVEYATTAAKTKTARARAARVLRVLDAAKAGEVTP